MYEQTADNHPQVPEPARAKQGAQGSRIADDLVRSGCERGLPSKEILTLTPVSMSAREIRHRGGDISFILEP